MHDELINMRKEKAETSLSSSKSGIAQWITFTSMRKAGQLMQSVTVPGGDVIQIPYEKEEE